MTISQPVLRDGEIRADHADPKAPVQGPLTIGAALLSMTNYNELRALHSRISTVRADYSVLTGQPGLAADQAADLEATWDEATGLLADISAATFRNLATGGAR